MEKKHDTFSVKYVDVLDGIRAISVFIVLIFHFWQQTWIFPVIKTPFLGFLGITQINFTPYAKVGYLFVDMMVLISGFLLFLPVARNVFLGEPLSKWKDYYKKRAIRILPSYLFCILVLFVYELINGGYGAPIVWKAALRDLFLHLTFMQTWTVQTYLSTKLNVVLWTLAIEVWFYILFPVFASIVKRGKKEKKPDMPLLRAAILAVFMVGVSFIYIYSYVLKSGSPFSNSIDGALASLGSGIRSSYLSMVINQLPAFMGTYAVGLVGSLVYVFLAEKLKQNTLVGLIGTLLSLGFIVLIHFKIKKCASLQPEDAQVWQMTQRLPLALAFMGFILSAAFSAKWFRFLFSNKLMRFLSIISYNLYIWHQWLCVKIKTEWRIPSWAGDTPPNQWGTTEGRLWSSKYAFVITVAAIAAAIITTYLVERPAADLLNGRPCIYSARDNKPKPKKKQ